MVCYKRDMTGEFSGAALVAASRRGAATSIAVEFPLLSAGPPPATLDRQTRVTAAYIVMLGLAALVVTAYSLEPWQAAVCFALPTP